MSDPELTVARPAARWRAQQCGRGAAVRGLGRSALCQRDARDGRTASPRARSARRSLSRPPCPSGATCAAIEKPRANRVCSRPSRATPRSSSATVLILKLFRMLDPGVNPDLEIGRFLTRLRTSRTRRRSPGGSNIRPDVEEPQHLGHPARLRSQPGRCVAIHAQASCSQLLRARATNKDRAVELPNKPLVNLVADRSSPGRWPPR